MTTLFDNVFDNISLQSYNFNMLINSELASMLRAVV